MDDRPGTVSKRTTFVAPPISYSTPAYTPPFPIQPPLAFGKKRLSSATIKKKRDVSPSSVFALTQPSEIFEEYLQPLRRSSVSRISSRPRSQPILQQRPHTSQSFRSSTASAFEQSLSEARLRNVTQKAANLQHRLAQYVVLTRVITDCVDWKPVVLSYLKSTKTFCTCLPG